MFLESLNTSLRFGLISEYYNTQLKCHSQWVHIMLETKKPDFFYFLFFFFAKFEFQNPEVSNKPGPDDCPQLLDQDGEILIPVGVSRDIKVNGTNLPDVDRVRI